MKPTLIELAIVYLGKRQEVKNKVIVEACFKALEENGEYVIYDIPPSYSGYHKVGLYSRRALNVVTITGVFCLN